MSLTTALKCQVLLELNQSTKNDFFRQIEIEKSSSTIYTTKQEISWKFKLQTKLKYIFHNFRPYFIIDVGQIIQQSNFVAL